MARTEEQRGVMMGMAAAIVTSALTLIGCILVWSPAEVQATYRYRFVLLGASALAPTLTLAASIARLASHRFFTPQDIAGSASPNQTERARYLQALIQNTLEQAVLGLLAYLSWCALAPARFLSAVIAAAVLFFIGRIVFFISYKGGAASRSFGFAITFYPTVALTLGNVWFGITLLLGRPHGA